jgi:hypothetical protein
MRVGTKEESLMRRRVKQAGVKTIGLSDRQEMLVDLKKSSL